MRPLCVVAIAYACNEPLFLQTFAGRDTEALREYWRRSSHKDWFKTHPYGNFIESCPEMAIPIRVHGDDASQNLNSSFLAISLAVKSWADWVECDEVDQILSEADVRAAHSNANTFLERLTAGDPCIYIYIYIERESQSAKLSECAI